MMFEHVLVTLDGSEGSECALPYALSIAAEYGARLTAFAVPLPLEWEDVDDYLETKVARLRDEGIVEIDTATGLGEPAAAIVAYARSSGVDLVVMGTQGKGAEQRYRVGSVAQQVLADAPCPVLMVRVPEAG
jgi:nucleotide-binding universal stress UspA family protein